MDTDTTDAMTDVMQYLLRTASRQWSLDADLDAAALAELLPWLPDVQELANQMLDDCLDDLWTQGWTPADLVHVVGRRLSRAHVTATSLRIVADGTRRRACGQALDARWWEQIADLSDRKEPQPPPQADERLRQALDVVALTRLLPSVPFTMPRPGDPLTGTTAAGRLDHRTLRRVRALLAKAESTDFEEEAHAFAVKAQELMARHSIDEALLHADDGEPSLQRILLEDPYLDAKASVVSAVAAANRCRTVLSPDLGWVTVLGYEQDLRAVELLSTSLLAQATSAMVRQGPRRDHTGTSRTRSYRRAFLLGFANRVGLRLRRATEEQVNDAQRADGNLLPVLASRDDRIRAAEEREFPGLRTHRATYVNADGWRDGTRAGDHANLDAPSGRLPGTGRS
jgi:hypothetical protein